MNRRPSIAYVISMFLIVFLLQVGVHSASAHFNTLAPDTDVQLQWPLNNSYSISFDLKVIKSPEANATIFWGHQFTFTNGEKGFIALGIGGSPKVATVGVFDAVNASTSNPTGACNAGISFLKTGNGYQCFIIYDWKLGLNYQLQFSRLADSAGSEHWQGSVLDYSTNSSTIIGDLFVPPNYNQLGADSSTWNEYSTAGSCETTPTRAIFSHAYALNAAGNHAPSAAQVTYGTNVCQDSNVVYLGGGAYEADAGKDVTRTTTPETWLWVREPTLVSQNSQSTTRLATTPISATPTTSNSAVSTTTSVMVVSTTQSQTGGAVSSNTTPLVTPAAPGFPSESIIAGLIVGLLALGITRHRRQAPDQRL